MTDETRDSPENSPSYIDQKIELAQRHHDRGLDFAYSHPKNIKCALEELDRAILLRESVLGKYHNDTALSYFRKARLLRETENGNEAALIVARREIRITHRLMTENNPDLSIIKRDSSQWWLKERVQWIRDVLLQSHEKLVDNDAAIYCSTLLDILEYERVGDMLVSDMEYELAIEQFECALSLESAAYARNVLEMADLRVKIGKCFEKMNEYNLALNEYEEAQKDYIEQLGTSSEGLGRIHQAMGFILLTQKKFDAALGAYAKAYAVFEQSHGRDHRIASELLNDIRLVTVKEMEEMKMEERRRRKQTQSTTISESFSNKTNNCRNAAGINSLDASGTYNL